jgi:hemoglobin-like flavoprotein
MTEEQISIIKRTWGKVAARSNALGEKLYPRFFKKAPETENLFKEGKAEQAKKLFLVVTLIVTKLNKLDVLKEELRALAKRHISYGVKTTYFRPFGEAFIESIADILGNDWNDDVKESWEEIYTLVSSAMSEAMS